MSSLRSSTIKVGPHPDRLEGTYRNRPAYVGLWAVCVLLVPLAGLAPRLLSGWHQLVADAVTVLALGAAVVVGRYGVRPRFEVGPSGVTVVNPTQSWVLAWSEIASFRAGALLVVVTTGGEHLGASSLPTRGWGGPHRGHPGPVADLAERLNARLAAVHAEALTPSA